MKRRRQRRSRRKRKDVEESFFKVAFGDGFLLCTRTLGDGVSDERGDSEAHI